MLARRTVELRTRRRSNPAVNSCLSEVEGQTAERPLRGDGGHGRSVRVTDFIELSRRMFGCAAPSSRGMIHYASGLHRSAPHRSDESKCQILPRVNMLWPSRGRGQPSWAPARPRLRTARGSHRKCSSIPPVRVLSLPPWPWRRSTPLQTRAGERVPSWESLWEHLSQAAPRDPPQAPARDHGR